MSGNKSILVKLGNQATHENFWNSWITFYNMKY